MGIEIGDQVEIVKKNSKLRGLKGRVVDIEEAEYPTRPYLVEFHHPVRGGYTGEKDQCRERCGQHFALRDLVAEGE